MTTDTKTSTLEIRRCRYCYKIEAGEYLGMRDREHWVKPKPGTERKDILYVRAVCNSQPCRDKALESLSTKGMCELFDASEETQSGGISDE